MPLTGAEKQRRYWQRLKDRAAAGSPQQPEEVDRMRQELAACGRDVL
jgi:hypothetical protein